MTSATACERVFNSNIFSLKKEEKREFINIYFAQTSPLSSPQTLLCPPLRWPTPHFANKFNFIHPMLSSFLSLPFNNNFCYFSRFISCHWPTFFPIICSLLSRPHCSPALRLLLVPVYLLNRRFSNSLNLFLAELRHQCNRKFKFMDC